MADGKVPNIPYREQRRHNAGSPDQRGQFARDRDRIHYSSAFRRLGGVSQVVSTEHIEPFHNRLTHTTKVAQLGRRLAEYICSQQRVFAQRCGLDPEVVEAACLAHDLGHPPFGHVGESALDTLVIESGDEEGYEGNAQSFRILTKLALRSDRTPGLDLTRAVLNASIKYPWAHAAAAGKSSRKFGYYKTERKDFEWARQGVGNDLPSIEAALMDYADDIAYSVHDIEDFHRIRAVPWQLLQITRKLPAKSKLGDLIQATLKAWYKAPSNAEPLLESAAESILKRTEIFGPIYNEPYEGTREQRVSLRNWTSNLIRRYVRDLRPRIERKAGDSFALKIEPEAEAEIRLLKQITRKFVIEGTTIGAQQLGQRRIVNETYADLFEDIQRCRSNGERLRIVPKRFEYLMHDNSESVTGARLAADCIASLTENELTALHKRLRGSAGGSIVDPIVW